jgi:hypothetical protein
LTKRKKKVKENHYFINAKKNAPINTEKRFVFLWEEDFETFNFDKYDSIKSNGVLTKQDLNLLDRELKKTGYYKIGETSVIGFYVIPWIIFLAVTIFIVLEFLDKRITN